MNFLSVCSGIEAASCAWEPLGWRPAAFSEIDPFACALLAHRFPHVPNLGDMTAYDRWTITPPPLNSAFTCRRRNPLPVIQRRRTPRRAR